MWCDREFLYAYVIFMFGQIWIAVFEIMNLNTIHLYGLQIFKFELYMCAMEDIHGDYQNMREQNSGSDVGDLVENYVLKIEPRK